MRPADGTTLRGRVWFGCHVKLSVLRLGGREDLIILTSPRKIKTVFFLLSVYYVILFYVLEDNP